MKAITTLLFAGCLSLTAFGQRLTLNGTLIEDGAKGKRPVRLTSIAVAGFETKTNPQGRFNLVLSGSFSEGETVKVKVVKPGWLINHPLDGEWNLPNVKLQNIQTLEVIIVPRGSKALWTHARIEKQIAKLSDEIAKLKKEGDTPRRIDFSFYLREWAEQYGFTPGQVKAAFDEWAKAVEKSDDYRTLGLRAFYKNNFTLAATNFVKAAEKDEGQADRIGEQFDREKLSAYQNRKDAGNSLKNSYQFKEALEQYNLAKTRLAELISKDKHQWEQGEIEDLIGNAKQELGTKVEGKEGMLLLAEAVESFKRALAVAHREQRLQEWAMTQNNLGIALRNQSERTEGAEGARLLAGAVKAYRDALSVFTRNQWPQQWAMTQNNLGLALRDQGERIEGVEGARLLAEAVIACRAALSIYNRERWPKQWTAAQNCLGITLHSQGERTERVEGARLLAEAVKVYRDVLSVHTRAQWPQEWALTQNNLGIALSLQGERTEGSEGAYLFAEAVKAYSSALSIYNRAQWPQQWAMTQNNLGLTLRNQGERVKDANQEKLLRESVSAFQLALQIYDRRYLPLNWANTQNNLASAYYALQDWTNAAEHYASALAIYPNYKDGSQRASSLYHETLFRFAAAFELKRRWLEANPDDLSVLPAFAENHFTTGRFAECRARIMALLAQPELAAETKLALRLIEIANLLSLGQAKEVPAKLDLVIQAVVDEKKADFKLTWKFHGTLHFIGQEEKLAAYREWLRQLFNAAQAENRDAIIKGLREAKASFK